MGLPSGTAERVLESAERLFRTFGFAKTTVAEVARDAGISTAYIYRFYPSKIAICEAVCGMILSRLSAMLWSEATSDLSPPDRFRRIYERLAEEALRLLFEEERLLEIVRVGLNEHWASVDAFQTTLVDVARHILTDGVDSGDFKQVEDLNETASAISATLLLCVHPVLLQEAVKNQPVKRARSIAGLVLHGLSTRAGV